MSYASHLVGPHGKRPCFVISIGGVPIDISSAVNLAAPAAPYIDGRGMIVDVKESRTKLDRIVRMQVGGGFVVVLQDRDNLLRKLFSVRSYRKTFVTAPVTATATSMSVQSTTLLPSSGVVYVGAETIAYTGKTSTTLTGLTRGAFGSRPQEHRGGSDQGASVFDVPPVWRSRRLTLKAAFWHDESDNLITSTLTTLGTYRIEHTPVDLGDGRFEIRCSHLTDEIYKRKIGSGIVKVDTPLLAPLEFVDVGGVPAMRLTCRSGTASTFATTASTTTAVLVEFEGLTTAKVAMPLLAVTPGAGFDLIDVGLTILSTWGTNANLLTLLQFIGMLRNGLAEQLPGNFSDLMNGVRVASIKHILVLDGDSGGYTLMRLLTSGTGNLSNGAYDTLPGKRPTEYGGAGFRFGADVRASEIDTASLLAVLDGNVRWSWVVDGEVTVGDLIEDFCRRADCYCFIAGDGRLTFVTAKPAMPGPSTTLAERDVKNGAILTTVDERETFSRIRLEANYDPIDERYETIVDLVDEEIAAAYKPDDTALVVSSRSTVIAPVDSSGGGSYVRDPSSLNSVATSLRRSMVNSRGGPLFLAMSLGPQHQARYLGEEVQLLLPSVSDYRGGVLDGARGRIIEREPDLLTSDVQVVVLVEEPAWVLAPYAVFASVSGTAPFMSVVIDTADYGYADAAVAHFRVGDRVTIYRPSTNTVVGVVDDVIIANATATSLNLSNLAANVQAGDVALLSTPTTGVSQAGYAAGNYSTTGIARWR